MSLTFFNNNIYFEINKKTFNFNIENIFYNNYIFIKFYQANSPINKYNKI